MDNIESIVLRAQQGDEKAFQELYDKFYKKSFYTALKISNYCEADAEDIVQDTFMQIHRSIQTLREPKYFKTWLHKILISKSSHKFRDNKDVFMEPEKLLQVETHNEHREYHLPDKHVNNKNDKEVILHLLDELKPKQKEILILQYFHDFSMQEIADILDIPVGTVKSRALYARQELAEKVKQFEVQVGRKVGFHMDAIGTILAGALLEDFKMQLGVQATFGLSFLKSKLQMLSAQSTHVMMAVGITVAGTATCMGAYELYQNYQTQSNQPPISQASLYQNETKKQPFQAVVYQDIEIANCRDAYYTLKEWASNPKQLMNRSFSEKNLIRPVYEELKQYKGIYWDKLDQEGWIQAFEQ